jgi:hypothetical protein
MPKYAAWIAAVGAADGVAIGDLANLSHALHMVLAGLGGAIGAAVGVYWDGR